MPPACPVPGIEGDMPFFFVRDNASLSPKMLQHLLKATHFEMKSLYTIIAFLVQEELWRMPLESFVLDSGLCLVPLKEAPLWCVILSLLVWLSTILIFKTRRLYRRRAGSTDRTAMQIISDQMENTYMEDGAMSSLQARN